MSAPATERFDLLRRRLSCFLGDAREGRRSVGELIGQLERFGEVAIVGGMLRDLLLKDRYGAFSADVDLVVDAPDTPALRAVLEGHGATMNRFGGFALGTAWKSDVWLLGNTWAKVAGHRPVSRIEDLLETTFFNWDAVIYSPSRRRIVCRPGYLDDLDGRMLDINLEANPNPLGSCVRTLRAAVQWGATVSPRLAGYCTAVMAEHRAEALVAAETRSYGHRRLLNHAICREAFEEFAAAAASRVPTAPLACASIGSRGQSRLPLPFPAPGPVHAAPRRRRRGRTKESAARPLPELALPQGADRRDSGTALPL